MTRTIRFAIEHGDITDYQADVVVLKFARAFYGADQAVALKLSVVGVDATELEADDGDYRLVETRNGIPAPYALYIGVPRLSAFRYDQIQWFTSKSLVILAQELSTTRHIPMTIHGANFGLDETESLLVQFKATIATLQAGQYPAELQRITVVERTRGRVARLNLALERYIQDVDYAKIDTDSTEPGSFILNVPDPVMTSAPKRRAEPAPPSEVPATPVAPTQPKAPEISSESKPHAFVAMPFRKEMDDTFYYGIQKPIHEAGLLCERVDQEAVSGEIMEYVRNRIETAAVVVADLSMANPNVYLEVGYAWGKNRPTVLLVRDEKELQFDVRGQQCLTYNNSIRALEEMLSGQLKKMMLKGVIKK